MVFPDSTPNNPACPNPSHAVVATAGEALMDLVTEADGRLNPCAGGAVYNLTRALGLQQVPTLYLNPLSADTFGATLQQGLVQAGVAQAHASRVPQPTALAVVGLDAQGKASYSFYRDGVADRCVDASGLTAACDTSDALQIVATGCLALVPGDAHHYQPWLAQQRAQGRLVVVDANLRPAIEPDMAAYRASVLAALQHAHLIKASDDDLVVLGLAASAAQAPEAARALLRQTQAQAVVLTQGAQGATWVQRDGPRWHAQDPLPVTLIDTVGAGDCFLAGLLTELCDTPAALAALLANTPTPAKTPSETPALTPEHVSALLARGLASASLCVAHTGCVPPSRAEVDARLAHGRV